MDEVEIPSRYDDVEIIPVSPLRRLEARIRQIEQSVSSSGMPQQREQYHEPQHEQYHEYLDQVLDLIKSNQRLADEMRAIHFSMQHQIPQPQAFPQIQQPHAEGAPQPQALVSRMDDFIKSNQSLADAILKANLELANELKKIPSKLDELLACMKELFDMIKAAGEESEPGVPSDAGSVTEQLQKIADQNQKTLESNQAIANSMEEISRKIKTGTPISQLVSSYPRINIRSLPQRRQ